MKFTIRLILVVFSVWLITRGAIYLLPGDPVDYLVNESLIQTTQEKTIDEIRSRMDLNVPFAQRVFSLPKNESLITGAPVLSLIQSAFFYSLLLAIITFGFTFTLTIALVYLGFRSAKWDHFAQTASIFLASVPVFISGPLMLFVFSVKLNLFPITQHPILPSMCLALYLTGIWYRSISQKIKSYIPHSAAPGARARGLDEFRVFIFYIFVPCLGSLVRFFSSQIGILLNGSLIVEIIFQWPGLGFFLADAVSKRDFPAIEVSVMIASLITLLSLHVGKWLQLKLEPQQ